MLEWKKTSIARPQIYSVQKRTGHLPWQLHMGLQPCFVACHIEITLLRINYFKITWR